MKNKVAAIAIVALAFTAASALAGESRKLPQEGVIDGDDAATVRLTVVKRGGELSSVKGIRFKDLLADCESGPDRINLNLFGSSEISEPRRTFKRGFESESGGILRVRGKVSRSGASVRGEISGSRVKVPEIGKCDIPDLPFVTKR